MPIEFYATADSPPCRAVWMTIELLGVKYDWKEVSTLEGGTRTPEFLKLNPQHAVPVVVDVDGFTVVESRAIMMHLVRKYGSKDSSSLLPEDPKLRSLVEQRLFMEQGSLWPVVLKISDPVFRLNQMYDEASLNDLKEVLGWCTEFIKATGFVASTPDLSIADLSLLATYTSFRACDLFDVAEYPGLEAWAARCERLVKNYERCNGEGAAILGRVFKAQLEEVKAGLSS